MFLLSGFLHLPFVFAYCTYTALFPSHRFFFPTFPSRACASWATFLASARSPVQS